LKNYKQNDEPGGPEGRGLVTESLSRGKNAIRTGARDGVAKVEESCRDKDPLIAAPVEKQFLYQDSRITVNNWVRIRSKRKPNYAV
jgi:hypothetical protein